MSERNTWRSAALVGVAVGVGALLFGCPEKGSPAPPDAGAPADADAGMVDALQFLDACTSLGSPCAVVDGGPHCGACQYRVRFDRQACSPDHPCDTLFLLWAFMGCEGQAVQQALDDVLAGRPGYVAACVQPLYPGEQLPSALGAPARDDLVLQTLFHALDQDPQLGVWSGKNLLLAGCSAGATRYPLVAARTAADTAWLAPGKNGACFSEGVYNIPRQDAFIGEGLLDGGESCGARHARIASAFTVPHASPGHSCTASPQGQCACDPAHASRSWPGECGGGDCAAFETIVVPGPGGFTFAPGVSGADFAVPHWKLVSEGSSFVNTPSRCLKDVVPEAPIEGLCQALDADPAKTCTFATVPAMMHCADFMQHLSTYCVDWFEAL